MLFSYNTETLRTLLEPSSEAERRAVLKLIQVFLHGGDLRIEPSEREPLTIEFRGYYDLERENASS